MRKLFFIMLFLAIGLKLIAGDWALTHSGDTLHGEIKGYGLGQLLQVKLKQVNDTVLTLEPGIIQMFSKSNRLFYALQLESNGSRPAQHIFMPVKHRGDSIWLLKGNYFTKGCGCSKYDKKGAEVGLFLVKPSGEVQQVKRNVFGYIQNAHAVSFFLQRPEVLRMKKRNVRKLLDYL